MSTSTKRRESPDEPIKQYAEMCRDLKASWIYLSFFLFFFFFIVRIESGLNDGIFA